MDNVPDTEGSVAELNSTVIPAKAGIQEHFKIDSRVKPEDDKKSKKMTSATDPEVPSNSRYVSPRPRSSTRGVPGTFLRRPVYDFLQPVLQPVK